jgi:hypothetical protein
VSPPHNALRNTGAKSSNCKSNEGSRGHESRPRKRFRRCNAVPSTYIRVRAHDDRGARSEPRLCTPCDTRYGVTGRTTALHTACVTTTHSERPAG